jgi:flagellar FliL protein
MSKDKSKNKDKEAPQEGEELAEGEEGAPKKKKLPIMIIAAVGAVVVLGGGGAAAYFLIFAKPPAPAAGEHGAEAKDAHGKDSHDKKKDGHDKKKDDKKKEEGGGHGGGGEGAKVDPKTQPVVSEGPDGITYFALPSMIANIQTSDNRASYLKLSLTFEVEDEETVALLHEQMPRVNDVLQGFFRELRPEDLAGSQGNFQLRLEILRRINLVLAPHKIKSVLITEITTT